MKKELRESAQIVHSIFIKVNDEQQVSLGILTCICAELEYGLKILLR